MWKLRKKQRIVKNKDKKKDKDKDKNDNVFTGKPSAYAGKGRAPWQR